MRLTPWMAAGAGLMLASTLQAQTWRTLNSARQVWDREPIEVEIQYGAGDLTLRPAEAPMLYRMDLRYDEEMFAPITAYEEDTRTLRLGVRHREDRDGHIDMQDGASATIGLSRQVPMSLDVDFGAGEADLELGGIPLQRVEVSTGASETTVRFGEPNPVGAELIQIEAGAAELGVYGLGNAGAERIHFQGGVGSTTLDFGGRWTRDATASVQMGIGSVVLRFPRGLGVRLNKSSFLTSFDGEGLVKRGDSYFSSNWDSAPHKLTVDVDAAFGSIEVEWAGRIVR